MPQAIKHYTGTATGNSNATVYTCPASTIAIVLPTITVNQGASDYATFSWNSDSAAGQTVGNLSFYSYGDANDRANVSAVDKYNVLVTVPDGNSSNAITYFSATRTTLTGATANSSAFTNDGAADTNPITPSGLGDSSSNSPGVHATGPWVMSAGNVLSYYIDSGVYISYNFLILEEAAS